MGISSGLHTGLPEGADILGTPAPAVAGDTVVAAYSSGEIYALRIENGHPEWIGQSGDLAADGRVELAR